MKRINRTGEININKNGEKMNIITYNNVNDIIVEFENGYKVHTQYNNFKRGSVLNPYFKSVYGIGFIGVGKYKSKDKDNKKTIQYKYWNHMIERCYSNKTQEKHPTYKGCLVCDEWHNFQNFSKWFDENYYTVENEKMCLDKDILFKGNKVYSPKNCVFVPNRINVLFIKSNSIRGKYPIGVIFHKGKFEWQCNTLEGRKYSKTYNSSLEAFYGYKQFKEKYIKQVAYEYKNEIPSKLYEAMYRYEVEIND